MMVTASPSPGKRCAALSAFRRGYTLLEVMLTLAMISGIIASAFYTIVSGSQATEQTKLSQDVAVLNKALRQYEISGGSLEGLTGAQQVLDKLKTQTTGDNRKAIAGLRGSMVDQRIAAVMQTAAEAAQTGPRAVYRSESRQFQLVDSGEPGVRRFVMDASLAQTDFGTEHRAVPYELAKRDRWVWDYEESSAGQNAPAAPSMNSGTPTTEAAATTDKILTILQPPVYSVAPGTYALRNYPLEVSLTNPNPANSSEIKFSPGASAYQTYASPLVFEPGGTVAAYAMKLDWDNYQDSPAAGGKYHTVPETPALNLVFPGVSLSYVDLGGPMISALPAPPPPAGALSLADPAAIPAVYAGSNFFQPLWTLDGSDPLTSSSAQGSPPFSNGYPGDFIPVGLADWSTPEATLIVRAAVKTLRPDLVTDSPVKEVTLTRGVLPMRPPLVAFGDRDCTLTLDTSGNDIPEGARVFYTTNGSDPGNNAGEPEAGTLYTGPFLMEAVNQSATRVIARVYPPVDYRPWFTPSPAAGKEPPEGRMGGYIAGDFSAAGSGRNVARLNPDGTVDPTFNVGSGANSGSRVRALAGTGTGVIIGGDFTTFADNNRTGLAKLNANGSLDPTFAPVIEDSPASTPFTLDFASLGLAQNVALNGSDTKNTNPGDPSHGLSPNGGFNGFGSQTFSNLNGSGIDVTLHYSQNMSDADPGVNAHDGPNLHGPSGQGTGGTNPDARVTGASPLRLTNDRFGSITPATVGLSFSAPVFFDSVMIGNLSGTATAAEHGLFRAWSGPNAGGSVVAATSAVNFSAENGPLLGSTSDPVTANAAANLAFSTPGSGVYLATGTGNETENRYGRARFTYTGSPVQSLAFSNWTTSSTAGPDGNHDPSKPFGVAQDFSLFSYTDIDLLAGGGGTVGGVAAGGNLTYGANGGFWMGGVAGKDALVVNGTLTASGGNGALSKGNAVYGSTPNASQINVYNGTKRQGTNILPFAAIKAAHLSLSTQWKALANTGGASTITYGTPGGDGKVPITLNAGNLTGLVVFNMDPAKLVNIANWAINNVNPAATLLINIPGTTPTLQNFYLSNSGTANKTIFHFPDAITATFSSAGIPGTVFVPKGTIELGSNGSQINGQMVANKINLRSFYNGGEKVFTGTLPGPTGGPAVTTVDGARGAVTLTLAGFRRTTPLPGSVWAVKTQNDGKILIAGRFQSINGIARKNIARLNADGSLDTSFDPGAGPDGDVLTLSVAGDGAIAAGGAFTSWNGTAGTGKVVVLNANGTRRTSFVSPVSTAASHSIRWLSHDASGKVYIAGHFTAPASGIARLNANGSLDNSFSTGSGVGSGTVHSASIRPDGSLLIAGEFTAVNGSPRNRIALLGASGGVQTSWNPGSGFNGPVYALSQRSGSQTLLTGGAFSNHGSFTRNKVTALMVDTPATASSTWGPATLQINAVYAVE